MKASEDREKVARELANRIAERLVAAMRWRPKREYISGLDIPRLPRLIKARRLSVRVSAVLIPLAVTALFFDGFVLGCVSLIAILGALATMGFILSELLLGAGLERQREYKEGDSFGREYSFLPSIGSFWSLLVPLATSLLELVGGFGGLHAALSARVPGSYSVQLAGLNALFFSVITFASGVGDITPSTIAARFLMTLEIALSWVVTTMFLTSILSWVLEHQRRQHEEFLAKQEKEMSATEDLLREARLGIYEGLSDDAGEAEMGVKHNLPREGDANEESVSRSA